MPVASASSTPVTGALAIQVRGFELLGAACSPRPNLEMHGATATVDCSADGRISRIEWRVPIDMVGGPEESAVIAQKKVQQGIAHTSLRITNEVVWMQAADGARRQRTTTWMGAPSLMTDTQLAEAQKRAGLAETPPLRTGAAWKEALIQSGTIPPR
jgi:hypothetical protein